MAFRFFNVSFASDILIALPQHQRFFSEHHLTSFVSWASVTPCPFSLFAPATPVNRATSDHIVATSMVITYPSQEG